uniref:hypothetical protein n=2 Tax=Flavobacteriaceae TaxID=49546 RepID=UPI00404B3590
MECVGAYETALHLLAKEVLFKTKKILTPDFHHDYNPKNPYSFFQSGKSLTFDVVQLEKNVLFNNQNIIPDAICSINGKELFIEFANTHFVNHQKRELLINSKLPCIEINLVGQPLDEKALFTFFNSQSENIYWISNPKLDKLYYFEQLRLNNEKQIAEQNRIKEIEEQYRLSNENFLNYKNQNIYTIHELKNYAYPSKCPLRTKALLGFRDTYHYRKNPIFKEIIDGTYWNGQFYGRTPYGKNIYLKKEKINILPPVDINLTPEINKSSKSLYAALKEISEYFIDLDEKPCYDCKHLVDNLTVSKKEYAICDYKEN